VNARVGYNGILSSNDSSEGIDPGKVDSFLISDFYPEKNRGNDREESIHYGNHHSDDEMTTKRKRKLSWSVGFGDGKTPSTFIEFEDRITYYTEQAKEDADSRLPFAYYLTGLVLAFLILKHCTPDH